MGALRFWSIKLTFHIFARQESQRLKSCSAKSNCCHAEWSRSPPIAGKRLVKFSGESCWAVKSLLSCDFHWSILSKTYFLLLWNEVPDLTTGCPGNAFFSNWAIRWQMWLSAAEHPGTINISCQICVGGSDVSSSLFPPKSANLPEFNCVQS